MTYNVANHFTCSSDVSSVNVCKKACLISRIDTKRLASILSSDRIDNNNKMPEDIDEICFMAPLYIYIYMCT